MTLRRETTRPMNWLGHDNSLPQTVLEGRTQQDWKTNNQRNQLVYRQEKGGKWTSRIVLVSFSFLDQLAWAAQHTSKAICQEIIVLDSEQKFKAQSLAYKVNYTCRCSPITATGRYILTQMFIEDNWPTN